MALDPSPAELLTYPPSFSQRQLWFLDKLDPGRSVYNISEAFRLKGRLDRPALARSINEIVRRHESLRTTFTDVDGTPLQVVAPELAIQIPVDNLAGLPAAEREGEALRRIRDRANQPYDLKRGPLIRFALAHIGDEDHILLVGMHHIICDAWSMGVFLRELNTLYKAEIEKSPAALPELPIHYGDYAVWLQDWMQGEVRERLVDYWVDRLKGAPAVLDLPFDRPRPSRQSYTGSQESILLPAALRTSLNDLGKTEGATLFMILFAGFATLLHRYARQEEVVVGISSAGRGSPETHSLIGFFVNTLALRIDLSGDPSFLELVRRTKALGGEALDNEDLPFELLVDSLKPERSLAYSPVFQVMFSYQNTLGGELCLTGIEATPLLVETASSRFDLTVFASDRPEGVLLALEYSTDLFERATIRRLLAHFETLLRGAVANPELPISRVPLLDASEHQRLVVDWNRTAAEYPAEVPLNELVEEQARHFPQTVAVTCGGQALTYEELNTRANRLAAYLRTLGVGAETLVGVCLERSVDLIVAMLGIVKTGGAYLPLDPNYPDERLNWIAANSEIGIVIAAPEMQKRLPDFGGRMVSLDWDVLNNYAGHNLGVKVSGDCLAYVLYTSGSTGRPKGVAIPRKALVNLLWSLREKLEFTAADVWLSVTTISFDIAELEIWLPLISGGRLVVAEQETVADGALLQSELQSQGVTFLQATPSTWRLLLESGWQGKADLKAACGGEAMPRDLARLLCPLVSRLWNLYGPTETTIWSTAYRIANPDDPILIGRPIANTQIYILDQNMAPVPIGVSGELYIGGDGLARGYFHRDDLTAERFVESVYGRLYKTGDLARYRPDGNIECLGRNDHQIKLRGFRIEPEEIRAVLTQHPAIGDGVVVLDSSAGEPRLAAYLVAQGEPRPEVTQLREWVRRTLPDYMVPAVFVFLDALPLTPNGKVDRRALPAPDPSPQQGSVIQPRTPAEEKLAAIWRDTLHIAEVGIRDNFFELGGHSLLLIRLISQIEKEFGQRLPVATVMESPTIEALATVLGGKQTDAAICRVIPLKPQGTRPPFICLGASPLFLPLARLLGPEQPFCGVDLTQLKRIDLPDPCKLEDIARYVVHAIREYQPEGPYSIGGWCLYGVLAYETARQMMEQGDQVELLTLFDSPNVAYRRRLSGVEKAQMRVQKWLFHLTTLAKSDPAGMVRYTKHLIGIARGKMMRERERMALEMGIKDEDIRLMDLDPILFYAATHYEPPPYSGRVLMVQSDEIPSGRHWQMARQWREPLIGQSLVHCVLGSHDGMFKFPHVETLAAKMRPAFEGVGAATNTKVDGSHSKGSRTVPLPKNGSPPVEEAAIEETRLSSSGKSA